MSKQPEEKRWYVLRCRVNAVAVERLLNEEGMETFVPMHYKKKMRGGEVQRVHVPVIPGLVFVRELRSVLSAFIKEVWAKEGLKVYIDKERAGKEATYTRPVVVPDKQMEDFIFVCRQSEDKIRYLKPEEVELAKGDRIRIHGGLFDGREGELLEVKGLKRKQLVIRISDMFAVAAVNIEPKLIEVVEHPEGVYTRKAEGQPMTERQVRRYVETIQEMAVKSIMGQEIALPGSADAAVKMQGMLNKLAEQVPKDKFLKAAVYVALVLGYAAIQKLPELKMWKTKAVHFTEKLPDSILKAELWLFLALALKDEKCLVKAEDFTIMLQRPVSVSGQQLMDRIDTVRRFMKGTTL